jgi:acyl-CoA thioester hydrolase
MHRRRAIQPCLALSRQGQLQTAQSLRYSVCFLLLRAGSDFASNSRSRQGARMKIELPEHKKLVHEMTIPIRWGDMDVMGHVNNTIYFRYMETARIEWLDSLGVGPNPAGEGIVIANAFCNFIRQLEYPGEVRVRTYASSPGRSAFDSWAVMERADQPGVVCASGGATIVWVDFPAQKSAPLPDWLHRLVAE